MQAELEVVFGGLGVGVRNVSKHKDIVFRWPARGTGEHLRLRPGDGWVPIAGSGISGAHIWAEPTTRQGMDDGLGGW